MSSEATGCLYFLDAFYYIRINKEVYLITRGHPSIYFVCQLSAGEIRVEMD